MTVAVTLRLALRLLILVFEYAWSLSLSQLPGVPVVIYSPTFEFTTRRCNDANKGNLYGRTKGKSRLDVTLTCLRLNVLSACRFYFALTLYFVSFIFVSVCAVLHWRHT